MAQPVRGIISEKYKVNNVKPWFNTLIVDGSNLLRQCMADTKTNANGIHYGGIFQFFLQIKLLLEKVRYDYVYVVFDSTDSGVLRYKYYNGYKANRGKNYATRLMGLDGDKTDYWVRLETTLKSMEKSIYKKTKKREKSESMTKDELDLAEQRRIKKEIVDENFERERNIVMMYCVEMSIRVLFDDVTEGDDFIAYYVQHKQPNERVVIVSTDNDITQLISPTVNVYNRNLKAYIKPSNHVKLKGYPSENVVPLKILCGDTSDNIGHIMGLSEKRLFELMPEFRERPVTIEEVIDRARERVDERIKEKKKPLKWHENIINGVHTMEYDGDMYEINRKIIDLSEPLMSETARESIEEMMYAPMDPEGRSYGNLYDMICRDGIEELMDHNAFSRMFAPFKEVSDRERKRYQNAMSE